ncbi:MAG: hypothetical protein ACREXP_07275 [Steroidobacteraceae bacterium]
MLQTTNPRVIPRGAAKAEVVRKSAALIRRVGSTPTSGTTCFSPLSSRVLPARPEPELHAYVVGVAIGDGNLSNPNGRAVRLRVSCDTKYPALIAKIRSALERLLPENSVSVVASSGNYLNVSVYSNQLEALLGWKALGGSKQHQNVLVPAWIRQDRSLSIHCLQGLIETDGAVIGTGDIRW